VPQAKSESNPEPEPEPEPEMEAGPELDFGTQPVLESQATGSSGEAEVEQDWSSLQTNLELSGPAREFARNIQLESIDENRWQFLVPDTLLHLGSDSVVQNLRSALANRLGHPVKLQLHGASEPIKSVAAAAERAEINRMSEAERAIEEDPTVQGIKKKFGAKIVPDSIQPIQ
jgi:DNA polymerase-3 subunit gamma/tau